MDSLNTIPNSGSFGDVSAKLNDNFSKVGQSLTTLENVAIANKGYFDTLASLQAAFPSPRAGNIAYVANVASSTGYYIYNVVDGVWTASTVEAPAVGVNIAEYTKSGGSSKTTKQVEDDLVQLAGEVENNPVVASNMQNNENSFFVIPDNKILIKKSGFRVFSKSNIPLRVRRFSFDNIDGTDKIFSWDSNIGGTAQFLVLNTELFSEQGEAWINTPGLFEVIAAENVSSTHLILAAWYMGVLEDSVGLISQTVISDFNEKISIIPYYNNSFSFQFNNAKNTPAINNVVGECSLTINSFILLYRGIAYLVKFDSPKTLLNTSGSPGSTNMWLTTFSMNTAKLLANMPSIKDGDGYRYIEITDLNFHEYFFSDNKLSGTYSPILEDSPIYTKNDNLILLAMYKREPIGGVLLQFYSRYNISNFRDRQYFAVTEWGTHLDIGLRKIGNRIIFKHLQIYSSDFGTREMLYYQLYSDSEINIDLKEGDTLVIDTDVLQKNGPTKISLEQKDSSGNIIPPSDGSVAALKLVSYGGYNNNMLPVITQRHERSYEHPVFSGILEKERMKTFGKMFLLFAGEGSGVGISIRNTNLVFNYRTMFIYVDSPYNDTQDFIRINIDTPIFSIENTETLVLDGDKILRNNDSTAINLLSEVIKKVNYGRYSPRDICIAHNRNGYIHLTPLFAAAIVNQQNESTLYSINKTDFLPAYFSVQETKYDTWVPRLNILHITDTHIGSEDAEVNLKEAIKITQETNVRLSAVIVTGDITIGSDSSYPKSAVLSQMNTFRNAVIESETPVLAQLGNHDSNDGDGILVSATTKKEQWDNLFSGIKNKYTEIVWGDEEHNRHYHYYDISHSLGGIRIIMLDQLDHDSPVDHEGKLVYRGAGNAVYSQRQIDWLCDTLNSTPEGYGVIIGNHYAFMETGTPENSLLIDGQFVQGWRLIPEIIQAWSARSAINKTYYDSYDLQNIIVSADFSSRQDTSEFICYLVGHTHYRTHRIIDEYGQLLIFEDSSGQRGTVFSNFSRVKKSPTSNTFSILSIDRPSRKIYRTSYGAYKDMNTESGNRIEVINY